MRKDDVARKVAEALRQGEGPTALLDITLDGIGEGWAKASMPLTLVTLNGHGNAHGGMLFLLADTAFAYACNSGNVATVAQAATITFLSPGKPGERILAHATEAALAGRTGVFDVLLTGEDTRFVAVFQGISRSLGRPALPDLEGEPPHG
jgi:acyl-CoA thioesterase